MSNSERRRRERRRHDLEAEQLAAARERDRKEGLTLWERIMELDVDDDLRHVLLKLAEGKQ